MKASPSLCFFLALMVLLHHPVAAYNWQGTGNFTNTNITDIWRFIEDNLIGYYGQHLMQNFAQALSTQLNNRWDPAWNVVIVALQPLQSSNPTYNDAILYGYAFNNHWMWYNGHQIVSTYTFSYVIWKDYNCQGWKNIGTDAAAEDKISGFTAGQKTKIAGWIGTYFNTASILSNPWGQAKLFIDALQADSDFVVGNNHAYSIVLSQAVKPPGRVGYTQGMYGRLCVVERNFYYSLFDYGDSLYKNQAASIDNGLFMLIQTR